MTEHELYRKVVETREYRMKYNGDDDKLRRDLDTAAFVSEDPKATIRCTCGQKFRKNETALDHLEDVGQIIRTGS